MDAEQMKVLVGWMRRCAHVLADLEAVQREVDAAPDEAGELAELRQLAERLDNLSYAETLDLYRRAAALERRLLRYAPRRDAFGRVIENSGQDG